jgi:hypothetical protein
MSPGHRDLVHDFCPDLNTIDIVDTRDKLDALKNATKCILEHQVVWDPMTGRYYHVSAGSGMGTLLSCELCDMAYYNRVERVALARDTVAKFGLKAYCRYRDDVFAIFPSSDMAREWLKLYRSLLSGAWTCKVESVSKTSVHMLDITVLKNRHFVAPLMWKPFFKPTSNMVPLSCSSSHHSMVHGWPKMGLVRLACNSATSALFESAKLEYTLSLLNAFLEPSRILDVMLFHPFRYSSVRSQVAGAHLASMGGAKPKECKITLVLNFHPLWNFTNIQSAVNSFVNRNAPQLEFILGCPISVRIAWRNASRPVDMILRNFSFSTS